MDIQSILDIPLLSTDVEQEGKKLSEATTVESVGSTKDFPYQ